ncbi:ankyrin repeat-containing domain protein [Tribonema minus]|uniref:Ankyrin repeat-containing domain protein n=1 Tax=Tribonema minus TaxID=303371 RepID=A0A835YYY8_9STRA|nr:ankyrin repeat-containing domain protein [Tribonema minus]
MVEAVSGSEHQRVNDLWQAQSLAGHGFDVNNVFAQSFKNTSLLHIAAAGRSHEVVERLLSHGAAVNCLNGAGQSPLHCAATPDIARILVRCGADVNLMNPVIGWTAVSYAMEKAMVSQEWREWTIELLAEHDADVEAAVQMLELWSFLYDEEFLQELHKYID